MPSNPVPATSRGYIKPVPRHSSLELKYEHLREDLERSMAEPVKDFFRIDQLIDQLEMVQLAIKEEHGIKGNNPHE